MAKTNDSGVYKKENGNWEYRFAIVVDGRRIERKKGTDSEGNKLRTKTAAVKARAEAIHDARFGGGLKPIPKVKIKEIYRDYCKDGRIGKAYGTTRKQDSLWENHLNQDFGNRFVDEITVTEINSYLAKLYYECEYSFQYTESFLKMFYLLFGQAYDRDLLSSEKYKKLCVNKETKIRMPKKRTNENDDVVCFTAKEIEQLDTYFRGTNAETAYLLGRYCGLRIAECYGIKWSNVDFENSCIIIDRQMQYQNGLISLIPPKTHNATRKVYMNSRVKAHLLEKREEASKTKEKMAAVVFQKQKFIRDIDGENISSLELVNCLKDGTIQTTNSMKYHSQIVKEKLGITFRFHYLRHTYGTRMAEHNIPQHILCNQMGHANVNVTQKYYIAVSDIGVDLLKNTLESI